VGHVLHLATVVAHAHQEVALNEVVERGIEVKHACFAIAVELVLERALDLMCGDTMLLGDVLKLADDHVEDPGEEDTLHAL
jgi:hypothetical protein